MISPLTNTVYPVTERALFQRLKRRLEKEEGHTVCKSRFGSRAYYNLGDYYIVDIRTNTVINYHVNIEELARERGVLLKYETVVSEE